MHHLTHNNWFAPLHDNAKQFKTTLSNIETLRSLRTEFQSKVLENKNTKEKVFDFAAELRTAFEKIKSNIEAIASTDFAPKSKAIVYLSGGIDSEIVLHQAMQSKIAKKGGAPSPLTEQSYSLS